LFSDVTRNICSKHTKNKTVANIKIDPELIQTPEIDRKFDGPLHLSDASGPRREYETPVHKHNYTLPATTSKKSQLSDLRSLTNSLVRKKKVAGTSTQFQSVPRCVPHLYKVSICFYEAAFSHISPSPVVLQPVFSPRPARSASFLLSSLLMSFLIVNTHFF
jgi:hypothetical protein